MRRAYAAVVLLAGAALASPASADTLHGLCPGCTEQKVGGNDVTVLGAGGVTGFGFASAPGGLEGDLQLKFLIPNSFTLTQTQNFVAQVSVTGDIGAGGSGTLTLFNNGQQFTGGFLEEFLGHPGVEPKGPLGAFLGATQTVQPTATGYRVALADVGDVTLGGTGDPLSNAFSLSPAFFASGGLILGNLFTDEGIVSTAQSAALFFNGVSGGPFCTTPSCTVSVPGPIVGAGIPGLVAAFIGMLGLRNWRRRRYGDLA